MREDPFEFYIAKVLPMDTTLLRRRGISEFSLKIL
jgi:hypothetical protein